MVRNDDQQARGRMRQVAVLIDADNIRCIYRDRVERCARRYGEIVVCRGFGVRKVPGWSRGAVFPDLQWARPTGPEGGKNSADKLLIRAALKLLRGGKIDCYCIVSNDRDFSDLARRIREAGKIAVGIGQERLSSAKLREACDIFEILDPLPATGPGVQSPGVDWLVQCEAVVGLCSSRV